jgi:hypothetical protein
VTKSAFAAEDQLPGSIPPVKVSPNTMIAEQFVPLATRSACRIIIRLMRLC